VTWNRASAARALADVLEQAALAAGDNATIFDKPPLTLNPPAIVVGRPASVNYQQYAFGIDEVELPVTVVAALDGDDRASELIDLVRTAILDPSLGGVVQGATPTTERNWRTLNVAGTDLLVADVMFTISM
jgi:hypothetical protein